MECKLPSKKEHHTICRCDLSYDGEPIVRDEAIDRGVSTGLCKLHFQCLDGLCKGSVLFFKAAAHFKQRVVTSLVRLNIGYKRLQLCEVLALNSNIYLP